MPRMSLTRKKTGLPVPLNHNQIAAEKQDDGGAVGGFHKKEKKAERKREEAEDEKSLPHQYRIVRRLHKGRRNIPDQGVGKQNRQPVEQGCPFSVLQREERLGCPVF